MNTESTRSHAKFSFVIKMLYSIKDALNATPIDLPAVYCFVLFFSFYFLVPTWTCWVSLAVHSCCVTNHTPTYCNYLPVVWSRGSKHAIFANPWLGLIFLKRKEKKKRKERKGKEKEKKKKKKKGQENRLQKIFNLKSYRQCFFFFLFFFFFFFFFSKNFPCPALETDTKFRPNSWTA